ncbi:MAG: reverse transcriptase/maturase family protein [Pseudomonadota bacterium]|nr:reverse transcriptase/maturase family protein [Pseudomonadota bacterium]
MRDRVAQTAAALVLTPVLDPEFEDVSYGYREGRSVDQAVRRIMQLRDRGFRWMVDADIERYFDEIPSDKLLERLARHVDEEALLALVRRWLAAEVRGRDRRIPHDQGRSAGLPALAAAREPLPRPPRRGAPACRT